MKVFLAYQEGITRCNSNIIRPGETFNVSEGASREGYHGYKSYYKILKGEDFLSLEEIADVSTQYINSEVHKYRYKGEGIAIVKQVYNGVNNSYIKFNVCLPAGVEVVFAPEIKKMYLDCVEAPKRLFRKWIRDCCTREGRPIKFWEDYARVKRCVYNKKAVWFMHQLKKEKFDYPAFYKISSYYDLDEGYQNTYIIYHPQKGVYDSPTAGYVDEIFKELTPYKIAYEIV